MLAVKNIRKRKIVNFHPSGDERIPNGHIIQKGGYLKECKDNKNQFISKLKLIDSNKFLRGIITLDTINSTSQINSDVSNWIDSFSSNYIIGNQFIGTFKSKEGNLFNEKSTTIEIDFINRKSFLKIIKELVQRFNLQNVLVRNFTDDELYIYKA